MHEQNCFITLTFSDEGLALREKEYINKNLKRVKKDKKPLDIPHHTSTFTQDFQLFMKRLRKSISPKKIKFYQCGEYGDKYDRPHYHAIIFGHDFEDKTESEKAHGNQLYESKVLQGLWPYGSSAIGDVTFESAAYVARYIIKKINGTKAANHYNTISPDGETISRKPESTTMSNGIGKSWFEKYQQEAYAYDYVIINGHKSGVPKYYDQLLKLLDEEKYQTVIDTRVNRIDKNHHDLTPARLKTRELVAYYKIKNLKRDLT